MQIRPKHVPMSAVHLRGTLLRGYDPGEIPACDRCSRHLLTAEPTDSGHADSALSSHTEDESMQNIRALLAMSILPVAVAGCVTPDQHQALEQKVETLEKKVEELEARQNGTY